MNFLPLLLFLSTFFIYWKTLCPTVFWRDTGEFLVAAYGLGIPHSPGTPIYPILGRLFSLLPFGTIPFRINLMSAFFASLSVVLLYFIILLIIRNSEFGIRNSSFRTPRFAFFLSALVGALLFAFSHPLWFYSVVAEVYTLQQALIAGVLLVALLLLDKSQVSSTPSQIPACQSEAAGRNSKSQLPNHKQKFGILKFGHWIRLRRVGIGLTEGRLLLLLAFLYGFALTNHGTSLLMAPALLFLLVSVKWLNGNWLNKIYHSPFVIYSSLFFFLLPITLYLYLPIRSAQNPYLDWGDPESLAQFGWVITAQEFQQQLVSLKYALTGGVLHGLWVYAKVILADFTPVGLLLALMGTIWLGRKNGRLLVFTGLLFFINLLYGFLFGADLELEAYLLTSHLIFALWIGLGVIASVEFGIRNIHSALRIPLSAFFLILPLYTLFTHYPKRNLSHNEDAIRYIREVADGMEEGEVFLTGNSVDLFLLYYLQAVEKKREDLVPVYLPYLRYSWHREQINAKLTIQNSNFKIEDLLTSSFTIDNEKLKILIANLEMPNARFTYTPLSKIEIDPELLHPSGLVLKVSDEPLSPKVLDFHKVLRKEFYSSADFGFRPETSSGSEFRTPHSALRTLDEDTRRHYLIVHSYLGEFFFQRGFLVEAEREYREALVWGMGISEFQIQTSAVLLNLGLVFEKGKKWGEAKEAYKKILGFQETRLKIEDSNLQSVVEERLGRVYLLSGEPSKSLPHLEKALQYEPHKPEVHYNLGRAYLQLSRNPEAESSKQLNPSRLRLQAIYHNEEAIQLDSTLVEAYNNLGICYREQNDPLMALKFFGRAVEINSNYIESRYNLGMTYLQLSRLKEAKREFQVLAKAYPQDPKFSSALSQIESLEKDVGPMD